MASDLPSAGVDKRIVRGISGNCLRSKKKKLLSSLGTIFFGLYKNEFDYYWNFIFMLELLTFDNKNQCTPVQDCIVQYTEFRE